MIINLRYILLSILIINMFTFSNKALGNYERNFFELSATTIDGIKKNFKEYENKVILVVNVASNCGFTKQYDGLQNLWDTYKDNGLIVLGIPSNQFGSQEPGSNKQIKNFCEVNFSVNFPMTEKTDVKGDNAHDIYNWAKKNHGKSTVPKWNFHKILIDKNGKIHDTFSSLTKPTSKKITSEIELLLNIK